MGRVGMPAAVGAIAVGSEPAAAIAQDFPGESGGIHTLDRWPVVVTDRRQRGVTGRPWPLGQGQQDGAEDGGQEYPNSQRRIHCGWLPLHDMRAATQSFMQQTESAGKSKGSSPTTAGGYRSTMHNRTNLRRGLKRLTGSRGTA